MESASTRNPNLEQEAVYIKELRTEKDRNGAPYTVVMDGFNNRWNLFRPQIKVELGKGYLFRYEKNGEFKNVREIEFLANVFKFEALKELANLADHKRDIGIATSYSIQLVTSGKIELNDLFTWADKIYDYTQKKANDLMPKEIK